MNTYNIINEYLKDFFKPISLIWLIVITMICAFILCFSRDYNSVKKWSIRIFRYGLWILLFVFFVLLKILECFGYTDKEEMNGWLEVSLMSFMVIGEVFKVILNYSFNHFDIMKGVKNDEASRILCSYVITVLLPWGIVLIIVFGIKILTSDIAIKIITVFFFLIELFSFISHVESDKDDGIELVTKIKNKIDDKKTKHIKKNGIEESHERYTE